MKNNKTQEQAMMHTFLFEPNVYDGILVTLKGDLTAENIETAIQKAYTQNETTMSKVVLENGEAYFQALTETGCKVMIDSRDWREIMHQNEKNTFKINEGEFIRSFIIPRKDEFLIFIMSHHIVGDGNALILFAEDILNNLAGKSVEYKPLLHNEDMLSIPKRAKVPFKSKIGLSLLNLQWKKTGKTFTWDDYFNIHEQFWKNRQTDIQIKVIEENEVSRIKAECKAMGISVNSYIFTQLLSEKPEGETMSFPFSMRGTNRSISNQITTIKFPHKYDAALSFEENAKNVHKAIKEHLENEQKKFYIASVTNLVNPTLMDGALMHAYTDYKNEAAETIAHRWGFVGDEKSDLGLTNLKSLNIETDYTRFSVKDMCAIAATMSSTKNVVCVSTLNDKMTLCYSDITN